MVDFKKALADKRAKESLERQLNAAKKSSAPGINPWAGGRKKKEEEPPPPDLQEFDIPVLARNRLGRMITQLAAITATQGALKKEKAVLNDEIKPLCKLYKLDRFMVGENRAAYYRQTKKQISRELLIQHNVDPAVIDACTVTSETWAFKASGASNGNEQEADES